MTKLPVGGWQELLTGSSSLNRAFRERITVLTVRPARPPGALSSPSRWWLHEVGLTSSTQPRPRLSRRIAMAIACSSPCMCRQELTCPRWDTRLLLRPCHVRHPATALAGPAATLATRVGRPARASSVPRGQSPSPTVGSSSSTWAESPMEWRKSTSFRSGRRSSSDHANFWDYFTADGPEPPRCAWRQHWLTDST